MRTKKSLGQHFLREPKYAVKLAESLTPGISNLVEVGPGHGMLTQYLVPLATHLLLIEKDTALADLMRRTWLDATHVHVEEADVLSFDFASYFKGQPFVVAGNFPYNISSQIVFRVLDLYSQVPEMVGMFQLEMAQRIAAGPGGKDYGIISVLTALRYDAKVLFRVPPGAFHPPPKVTSAVIRLERKPEVDLPCSYRNLRTIVKSAFGQRRKMLRNSLKALFADHPMDGMHFERRPEQLALEEFIEITRIYETFAVR